MSRRQVSFIVTLRNDGFVKAIDQSAKKMDRFARNVERTGRKLTKTFTVPIVAMGTMAAKSAIDFESAFAGVRKTVEATEAEFAQLHKGILDMSKELPTSANEIAGVAEAAGQLGIQTDKILGFSKVMVMLGDTTNMAADEAAMNLARFANIMQLPQDQFDRVGSTIVDLGNKFATTEREITEFATRLAGAGQIAGMSASDVFGIATAMSSVGVQAEAGGTAVQKALIQMNTAVAQGNKHLATFAETAGMSSEQFQKLWREDAGQAFAAFVNGLGRAGDDAVGVLSKLGLADQRLIRSFLSLANAGDLVTRAINTGSQAWQENTALTEEAQQRYDTIASKLHMLWNRITALGIAVGDKLIPFIEDAIEFVDRLTDTIENMSEESIKRIADLAIALAVGGPLMMGLAGVTKALSGIAKTLKGIIALQASTIFGAIATAVAVLGTKIATSNIQIGIFRDNIESLLDLKPKGTREEIDRLAEGISKIVKRISEIREKSRKGLILPEVAEREIAKLQEEAGVLGELRKVSEAILKAREEQAAIIEEQVQKNQELNEKLATQITLARELSSIGGAEIPDAPRLTGERVINTRFRKVDAPLPVGSIAHMQEKMSKLREEMMLTTDPERFQHLSDRIEDLKLKIQGTSQAQNFLNSVTLDFTSSFGQGLNNLIVQGEKLQDVLKNIGRLLVSSVIQKGISVLLTGGLGGSGFFGSVGGLFGKIFGVNDALITSQGDVVKFHPDDNILAMKDFSKLSPASGGGQVIHNVLNLDGRVIWENQTRVGQAYDR